MLVTGAGLLVVLALVLLLFAVLGDEDDREP
jgi:hypothetical protein